MASGIVKWFDGNRGFGFIEQDDGSDDLFVHHTAILMEGFRALIDGDRVTFEIEQTEKGPSAVAVTVL
jgi:CspA family cold shock protein